MTAKKPLQRPVTRPDPSPTPTGENRPKRLKAGRSITFHPTRMINGPHGLICPWCSGHIPIHKCPHNPFQLAKSLEEAQFKILELRDEIYRLNERVEDMETLRTILRRLLGFE